jgi:hypothetical protein
VASITIPCLWLGLWLGGFVRFFAFRCGRDYGTILIDVETGRPVDLLRDREAATVADWLKEHLSPRRLVSCCSFVS